MGIEGFLKVPDIPGASARRGHEGEIEVHGVTFSMEAPRDPLGGARKGRATVDNVVFTKYYDQSSPYLKKALFDNTRLAQVVFSALRTTEGEESDYLVVTLKRCRGDELRDATGGSRVGADRRAGRLQLPDHHVQLRRLPRGGVRPAHHQVTDRSVAAPSTTFPEPPVTGRAERGRVT